MSHRMARVSAVLVAQPPSSFIGRDQTHSEHRGTARAGCGTNRVSSPLVAERSPHDLAVELAELLHDAVDLLLCHLGGAEHLDDVEGGQRRRPLFLPQQLAHACVRVMGQNGPDELAHPRIREWRRSRRRLLGFVHRLRRAQNRCATTVCVGLRLRSPSALTPFREVNARTSSRLERVRTPFAVCPTAIQCGVGLPTMCFQCLLTGVTTGNRGLSGG